VSAPYGTHQAILDQNLGRKTRGEVFAGLDSQLNDMWRPFSGMGEYFADNVAPLIAAVISFNSR
jgi:hypothetical protein